MLGRSKIRMLAFVKDTVGESVVKDIPEWVIKCLVKIDKERWWVPWKNMPSTRLAYYTCFAIKLFEALYTRSVSEIAHH